MSFLGGVQWDRFLIQLAAGESGYETPSDQDALEQ
jgi:hypothetical protein